jgi:hypothetical protein
MNLAQARAEVARRGLRLDPFGSSAHRIHGRGVDVLVSDLYWLKESDLRPAPAQGAGMPGLKEQRLRFQR